MTTPEPTTPPAPARWQSIMVDGTIHLLNCPECFAVIALMEHQVLPKACPACKRERSTR